MGEPSRFLLPMLVYCGLSTAVIGSLGVLRIPAIAEAQHVCLPAAQWILTLNLLVGSVGTPVLGRLADGDHPRRGLRALGGRLLGAAGLVVRALQAGAAPGRTSPGRAHSPNSARSVPRGPR